MDSFASYIRNCTDHAVRPRLLSSSRPAKSLAGEIQLLYRNRSWWENTSRRQLSASPTKCLLRRVTYRSKNEVYGMDYKYGSHLNYCKQKRLAESVGIEPTLEVAL